MSERASSRGMAARTERVHAKPYARPPTSAAALALDDKTGGGRSSGPSTPKRATPRDQHHHQRGFLSSVADMLFSPFTGGGSGSSTRRGGLRANNSNEEQDWVNVDAGHRSEDASEQAGMDVDTTTDEIDPDQHLVKHEQTGSLDNTPAVPIQPILDVLSSTESIDPLQSIHLINDFNRLKRQLGQSGQPHTRAERRAIEELIARADRDHERAGYGIASPGGGRGQTHSLRGATSNDGLMAHHSSAAAASPARLARSSRFNKAQSSAGAGLSKSTSMNFTSVQAQEAPRTLFGTPIRKQEPSVGGVLHEEECSPPGRFPTTTTPSLSARAPPATHSFTPRQASPLAKTSLAHTTTHVAPPSLLRPSVSRYSLNRPSPLSSTTATSTAAAQPSSSTSSHHRALGGLTKSQSMFTLPKSAASTPDQSPGSSPHLVAFPGQQDQRQQQQQPQGGSGGRSRVNGE